MLAEIGVIYEKLAGNIREKTAFFSFKGNHTPSGKKKHDLNRLMA